MRNVRNKILFKIKSGFTLLELVLGMLLFSMMFYFIVLLQAEIVTLGPEANELSISATEYNNFLSSLMVDVKSSCGCITYTTIDPTSDSTTSSDPYDYMDVIILFYDSESITIYNETGIISNNAVVYKVRYANNVIYESYLDSLYYTSSGDVKYAVSYSPVDDNVQYLFKNDSKIFTASNINFSVIGQKVQVQFNYDDIGLMTYSLSMPNNG